MRVYAWRRVSEEPRFRTAKIASRRSCSPRGKLENEVSCPALLLISTGHFCWHRTCSEVSTNTGKVSLRKTSFSNYPRTFFFVDEVYHVQNDWKKNRKKKRSLRLLNQAGRDWSRLVWFGTSSVTLIVCSCERWGLLKTGRLLASTRELEANWSFFPSIFISRKPGSDPLLPISVSLMTRIKYDCSNST